MRLTSSTAKRLLEEKGFTAVAVGADQPDAFRASRFVAAVYCRSTPLIGRSP